MKKVVSISLMVLLLLNVMGYYGLFLGLRYKNTVRITHRIEAKDYSASETITIKIPLAIPYYGDTEFERVDGEIEHQGQFYRLVKQKLEKDTLHIVCIRDAQAKNIHEALSDYVSTFADQSADRSSTRSIQSFIKDYFSPGFSLDVLASGWSTVVRHPDVASTAIETIRKSPSPPPKG